MTKIKVTQKRSLIGCNERQRLTIKGLGLRGIGHSVELKDTAPIRGMILKVQHMLDVQVHNGEAALFGLRHK